MIAYTDLEMALMFATSGEEFGSAAYIDRETGEIYYVSDLADEEYPEDIEQNDRYEQIPHKRELGLGKSLAIEFTERYLPSKTEDVYKIFRSRGAYSAFKNVLENCNLLEKWYKYEEK